MSTKTDLPSSRAAHFVERLRGIENDRGKMAALRRGLSEATRHEAWPVIASLGQDFAWVAPRTVAALFAVHPKVDSKAESLGATCRRIATDHGREHEIPESFERRFRRLLACDSAEDVAGQLTAWVRFADKLDIGLNYERLFQDLDGWRFSADRIKLRWARDFWPARREEEEVAQSEPAP